MYINKINSVGLDQEFMEITKRRLCREYKIPSRVFRLVHSPIGIAGIIIDDDTELEKCDVLTLQSLDIDLFRRNHLFYY